MVFFDNEYESSFKGIKISLGSSSKKISFKNSIFGAFNLEDKFDKSNSSLYFICKFPNKCFFFERQSIQIISAKSFRILELFLKLISLSL